jgi:hypothetical protein
MEKIFSPHLHLAKSYWKAHLKPSDLAVDATCGNGHDTLFLSELCHVIGLDIQVAAIQNTEALLMRNEKKAVLHRLSHDAIDTLPLPHPPRLIVYNLGYLPRGDKSMTTKAETTLESVKKALEIVASDGALSITCYPGHDEGQREENALIAFAEALPSSRWSVCLHKWLNRPRSPSLVWIASQTCVH